MTDSSFTPKQVHPSHRKMVGFIFALTVYANLTARGSKVIYRPVITIARSLYRYLLSCKDAFPSSNMKDEWVIDVWNEACFRTRERRLFVPRDEEACLFYYMWPGLTRVSVHI
jgi:hypothetical protein